MSRSTWDVVVIGGGANGLTASATLARAGRRVLLLERAAALGGQGRSIEFAPGYRAAPLALDPGWLPPAVSRELELAVGPGAQGADHAAASLAVALEPGRFLVLPRDEVAASEAIRTVSAADAAKWPSFLDLVQRLTGFLEGLYQMPAPDVDASTPAEFLSLFSLGRRYRALGRHGMIELLRTLPMPVWEWLDDWFESPALKAALATGGIHDHAQGPRSGGTAFVLLHHRVGAPRGVVRGRPLPSGEPGGFTATAERAARRFGVNIRTDAGVGRIEVRDDAVSGVVLDDGEEIIAGSVLSTADPATTLLHLVDPVWLDPEYLRQVGNIRHRGSTSFVLYALDGLPVFPGLAPGHALGGLVSLTPDPVALERAADDAKYGRVSENPHVELTIPTLVVPDGAPRGGHVLVARVRYTPHRLRNDASWDPARCEFLAEATTRAIERASPRFRSHVRERRVFSPRDLEAQFGLREGAATQGELALDQILFMRPVPGGGRHDTPIAGLYLGGVGTHPGPGILGGSGWLAARQVLAGGRRRPSP